MKWNEKRLFLPTYELEIEHKGGEGKNWRSFLTLFGKRRALRVAKHADREGGHQVRVRYLGRWTPWRK